MKIVLVTNVTEYTGPGVVDVLLREGYSVLCHDAKFSDAKSRAAFENRRGVKALEAQTPEDIFSEVSAIGDIDKFVFNDVFPNSPKVIEDIEVDTLRSTFEALLVFPFRLTQLFLPQLKKNRQGFIVFITSARQLQPESGFAVATSIRAGTTAFSLALSKEVAEYSIQVNAIQPNYLDSELYYPKAKFVDDPKGQAMIAETVPFGRLGKPEELGELVEFFVSGRSPFTTGQVINFTGGWP